MHCAWHLPLAPALQVPLQVPAQVVPVVLEPLHVPLHMPSHLPSNIALQPPTHVPSQEGALHSPSQMPEHWTAASQVPWQVPMHATVGCLMSQEPLHMPLQATT